MGGSYEVHKPAAPIDWVVEVPGSKSMTNRALLMAALADGVTTLKGVLFSDDSRNFLGSLHRNGMPVYFRYCPGNIVDVSTLCTTVAELPQYGVSTDYAIVDAGYFSEDNVKELYRNGIRFVTRLAPNRKIYKQVAASELGDILSSKYAVRYGNRLVYLKKTAVDVYGNKGYAYIGMDMDSRSQQFKRAMSHATDDKLSADETDARMYHLSN